MMNAALSLQKGGDFFGQGHDGQHGRVAHGPGQDRCVGHVQVLRQNGRMKVFLFPFRQRQHAARMARVQGAQELVLLPDAQALQDLPALRDSPVHTALIGGRHGFADALSVRGPRFLVRQLDHDAAMFRIGSRQLLWKKKLR